MSKLIEIDNIEQQPLKKFAEKAYLNYSMYVILDRALPYIGDGLKPVQRRIIYAMSELGLHNNAKYKKSARTVGDVLGKFHPHGDTSCYEAMVLMAQTFSYRYPFIDGQGNWGSQDDPKSFAAMRYTESKLSKYANIMLKELKSGAVEWINNFDGTMFEPKSLPSRLPNIILNGTTGIAVGMSTDIPPHNLKEVTDACIHLLSNPKATVKDLCQFIQGPDFPTEAEIVSSKQDILNIYETGNGSIRMRAIYSKEQGDIIVTALPHLVSGSRILEQIANLMQNKKLPWIIDLRDESDHENPTRLIIVLRTNKIDADEVMSHLFTVTDLEKTYRINMNVIGLDNKPKVKNLKEMLYEWLEFRIEVVRKKLEVRLDKINERLHILEGLLIVFLNINEVIKIIRESDDPKTELKKKFNLSNIQVDSILDLKLRFLAKLEEMKIKTEQLELEKEKEHLSSILSSEKKLKNFIKSELKSDVKEFTEKRLSAIVEREEAKSLQITAKIASEPITVILSNKGWVRTAKGHGIDLSKLSYKSGDSFYDSVEGKSDQPVIFTDSFGKSYSATASSLPSSRGYGEPLTSKFSTEPGATFKSILMGENEEKVIVSSDTGYGFITQISNLIAKNKNGKAVISTDSSLPAIKIGKNDKVMLITSHGKLLIVDISEITELTKGKGKKLINITGKDYKEKNVRLLNVIPFKSTQTVTIKSGARKKLVLKGKDMKEFISEIGSSGSLIPKNVRDFSNIEIE